MTPAPLSKWNKNTKNAFTVLRNSTDVIFHGKSVGGNGDFPSIEKDRIKALDPCPLYVLTVLLIIAMCHCVYRIIKCMEKSRVIVSKHRTQGELGRGPESLVAFVGIYAKKIIKNE